MWQNLANGDVLTTIESFCVTFRADRYIHYLIKRRDVPLVSGSEDNVGAAVVSARRNLHRLVDGRLCGAAKARAELLIDELSDTPLPLTKAPKHVTQPRKTQDGCSYAEIATP